ncbi:hypothetical protein hmeg3_01425 [Herbaspirillum sp. meg3]|uniref:hypothetical protein n=1 Tax=Herbaspirillum sp. meg3 TaxID=2025949 RepID=UPI000B98DC82|nr:hypothetical protein [Herbaspirillum sp. meg3]ASU37085.1 hypothetical protein hmeg3_01425 [Herbaspirillum sp. meg3]
MKKIHIALTLVILAGGYMNWVRAVHAAASGQLGVSAMVAERCRVDFSEGSADYFQSCSSIDVKASEKASNVLGELIAVDATADPYYLDRVPESMAMTAPSSQPQSTAAARRAGAPKVVTINY